MKQLISNNPVLRFKLGLVILKFQNPSNPLIFNWNNYTPAGQELVDRAISQTRAITLPVEERIQKASKRNKSVAAKLLEMWNMGAFKGVIDKKTGKEVTFERAVDGIMGRMTREAEVNRNRMWREKKIETKSPEKKLSIFNFMAAPGYTPLYVLEEFNKEGQKLANLNPALALGNRYLHGFFNLNALYTNIPQDQVDVLSDLNLYIFDHWNDALNFNLNSTYSTLKENQEMLKTGVRKTTDANGKIHLENLSEEEISKLPLEIESNKKSIINIKNTINTLQKSGGLKNWLLNNPGQKMVVGVNMRFYKDRNRKRFGKNTPSGYANFENEYYVPYSMSTPLGKVESAYGNTVQSFTYDPKSNQILTKMSDSYDFNAKGTESNSLIAKLRSAAGNDPNLSKKGSIKYSVQLKPISIDEKNNNYLLSFKDVTRKANLWEEYLLNRGIKSYE